MGAACSQPGNIHRDDIIIPIVGRPGAGKSTFINAAVGRDVLPISHISENVLYVKCSNPGNDRRNIVFVEITLSELDLSGGRMIEELNHWLKGISLQGLKLPGILCLHRITDVEPIGVFTHLTSLRSRKEFSQLLSATQLMIVTTMWGALQSPSIGLEREEKLERYLTGLGVPQQDCMSRMMRFMNTFESAWVIIYACMENSDRLQLRSDHVQPNTFSATRVLISRIMKDTLQKACIAELVGEDAQCMADFLNIVLHEQDILDTDEGKSLLCLLRKLAKSAQVFPQCYELKGVQCDFSRPQEGGGFADIFKGEYENQTICVKAVRIFREQDNAQMLRAHVKELVLWAHLSHRNILPFYGAFLFGKEPQRLCIVSPWMHNGDLSVFLKNVPQAPRVPLISDIIAGLQYLHRYRIIHGDLKAKNILVSDDGRALITDFGISRIIMTTRLASTRLSNGTMRWTAPELLAGDGDDFSSPTPESDIWSFGCLCYEICTCKVPFYQYINDYRLLSALLKDKEIPIRPTPKNQFDVIDDCMWDLMRRCWDYAPSNRPACGEIQQCIAGMGIPDNRPQTPLQAPGPSVFWEDMRNKSEITIDCERVQQILLGVHRNQTAMKTPIMDPASLSRAAEAFRERIPLGDHVKDGLTYKDAFDGREAVDKVVHTIETTDRNPVLFSGRALDVQKFFYDVTYDHQLRDSPNKLYQFRTKLGSYASGELVNPDVHQNGKDALSPDNATPPAEVVQESEEVPLPSGVFTLLADCDPPTRSRDRLCYSISCPRRLEQQDRLKVKMKPGLSKQINGESLIDLPEVDTLWIHSVPQEIVASVSETEKKRQEAINEVIYTERDFVRDLEYLRDVWMFRIQESDVVPIERRDSFIQQVFWNVRDILTLNTRLRDALSKRQKSYAVVDRIGDIFLEYVPHFGRFVAYSVHQLYGKYEFEREKNQNPAFAQFVEATERLPESRKLTLNAFLTKPTTRLARYPLLLETVLKHTPDDSSDKTMIPKVIAMIKIFLASVNAESGKAGNGFNLAQLDGQLLFKPGEGAVTVELLRKFPPRPLD